MARKYDHNSPNYFVTDVETTGLHPVANCIIEIAGVCLDGRSLNAINGLEAYETFVQIYGTGDIDPIAMNTHGITMDEIDSGIDVKTMVEDMILISNELKNGRYILPIIVAHNTKFEEKMFVAAFEEVGKNFYDYFDKILEDTMVYSRQCWPNEKVHKLGVMCDRLGIQITDAHRAMNDVIPTAEAFRYFIKKIRGDVNITISGGDSKKFRDNFKFQF
jgi:DNA polymerase III alpha subunit (gram-positive type)